jgi:hypothetical protein
MKRHWLVAGAAVLALGFSASLASAQCAYQHPKKAKQFAGDFVQAMVSCGNPGGNTPNTTTEGGVPTCQPPESYNEQAGNPANGWRWRDPVSECVGGANDGEDCTVASECPGGVCPPGDADGTASVKFKAAKNKVVHPLITDPANTADLAVQFKASKIYDAAGLADGTGTLATVARATLEDRMGGDMTVVDFPAGFPFQLSAGKANLKTTANTLLTGIGQPGLPGCTAIEVVSVLIDDENGNHFGNLGTFLPDLP